MKHEEGEHAQKFERALFEEVAVLGLFLESRHLLWLRAGKNKWVWCRKPTADDAPPCITFQLSAQCWVVQRQTATATDTATDTTTTMKTPAAAATVTRSGGRDIPTRRQTSTQHNLQHVQKQTVRV
jgi:hypothetical protein